MRKLVFAAGGILLVGGVAIAVILSTGGDVSMPEMPAPVVAVPSGPVPIPVPIGPLPGLEGDRPAGGPTATPPVEYEPAPPPPPEDSWEAIPLATRPAKLGRIGPALANELNELQPRLALCFDEETQARHGQFPVSRALDGTTRGEGPTAVLHLNLEVQPGEIRIVDAPVGSQGQVSDGLVACAQRILRGHVLRTPVAREPAHFRLIFPLHK